MTPKMIILASSAAVALASVASAAFTGVSIAEFDGGPDADAWAANGHAGLITFRVYANFDGPGDDGVVAVFGVAARPLGFQAWPSYFYNDTVLGGLTAPLDLTSAGIWSNQWDTYVTINATESTGDETGVSPGFGTETDGLSGSWSTENGGWFVTPDDEQSEAVDGRVLLAQMTVESGAGLEVSGVVNLLLRNGTKADGLRFGLPAPGTFALLCIAGLRHRRRR